MKHETNAVAPTAAPTKFADDPALKTRRSWRLLRRLVSCIAVLVVGFLGVYCYRWHVSETALQDAIAEADRLDPGWRLADLEAERAAIPVERNSASHVRTAGNEAKTITSKGKNAKALIDGTEILWELSPRIRLTGNQTDALRSALVPFAATLAKGRKIADFPDGRYPFDTSPPSIDQLPHWEDVANIHWLLAYDAVLQMEGGEFDQAWACCHAIRNVGRSHGDQPMTAAQRYRALESKIAIGLMERALAHGKVSADDLAESQKWLREELKHPAILISLRGDRAYLHHSLSEAEAGRIHMTDLKLRIDSNRAKGNVKVELRDALSSHEMKPAHAWLLRYMTQAVEIAKLGEKDAYPALKKLESTLPNAPELARQLLPKLYRFDSLWTDRALIPCALAGLAAERYRLKYDRWPTELADLVAEQLLDEVPADPYDGKAVHYRKTPDGIVIYSVGPTGDGKGNWLDGNPPTVNDARVEFRLWDANKR